MKRILTIVFAAALSLCVLGSVALADGEPLFRVSEGEAQPGEEFTVTVSMENNPGIMAFAMDVEYDDTRLEQVGITHTGLRGLWAMSGRIVWVSGKDSTYEGEFLELTFRVKEDAPGGKAEVTVSYGDGDICNYNEESVTFGVIPGGVTVPGEETPENTGTPAPTGTPKPGSSPSPTAAPANTPAPEASERPVNTPGEPPAAPAADDGSSPAPSPEGEPSVPPAEPMVIPVEEVTAPVLGEVTVSGGEEGTEPSAPTEKPLPRIVLPAAILLVIILAVILVLKAVSGNKKGRHGR